MGLPWGIDSSSRASRLVAQAQMIKSALQVIEPYRPGEILTSEWLETSEKGEKVTKSNTIQNNKLITAEAKIFITGHLRLFEAWFRDKAWSIEADAKASSTSQELGTGTLYPQCAVTVVRAALHIYHHRNNISSVASATAHDDNPTARRLEGMVPGIEKGLTRDEWIQDLRQWHSRTQGNVPLHSAQLVSGAPSTIPTAQLVSRYPPMGASEIESYRAAFVVIWEDEQGHRRNDYAIYDEYVQCINRSLRPLISSRQIREHERDIVIDFVSRAYFVTEAVRQLSRPTYAAGAPIRIGEAMNMNRAIIGLLNAASEWFDRQASRTFTQYRARFSSIEAGQWESFREDHLDFVRQDGISMRIQVSRAISAARAALPSTHSGNSVNPSNDSDGASPVASSRRRLFLGSSNWRDLTEDEWIQDFIGCRQYCQENRGSTILQVKGHWNTYAMFRGLVVEQPTLTSVPLPAILQTQ
jgi:hypothetical protein